MQSAFALVFAALIAVASATSGTSSSSYASVSLPSSVAYYISSAESCAPSIITIAQVLTTIEFITPSLYPDEYVIESYAYTSPSVLYYIETGLLYPSQVIDTYSFDSEVSEYYTLAAAVSGVISIEETSPTLAAAQSTLQSVFESDSSILYYLSVLTDDYAPSIAYDSGIIDQATIVDSSAFQYAVSLSVDISPYVTASYYIYELSYYAYSLPSTVDEYIISYISSPSTIAVSELSYLASYYPTVYCEATYLASFGYYYPSIVSLITVDISVGSEVSSFTSAVSSIEYYDMPTFEYQESVISSAAYTWSSVTTDLSLVDVIAESSTTLASAFSTIEGSFYDSPAVAYSIYYAIVSPSTVTSPELISYEEMSHQSLVSAIDEITSFEAAYTQYASTISYAVSYGISAFETESSLLTAIYFVSAVTSASAATATYDLQSDLTVISNEQTVLSAVGSAVYFEPSLSCYEDSIESYAYWYPSVVATLWSVQTEPSEYFTEATYIGYLEDSYPSVLIDVEYIYAAAYTFPTLYAYEASFISAAAYESTILTDYVEADYAYASYEASEYWYSPVYYSSYY